MLETFVPQHPGSSPIRQPGKSGEAGADPETLQRLLAAQSPADVLAAVVDTSPRDVQRAAVVALGWKGMTAHSALLRALLHQAEPGLAELAEDSLWRIWMRAGSSHGNAELAGAINFIGAQRCPEALSALDSLVAAEPGFAEAHHQRGIVLFMLDRPAEAEVAFRRAVELNPDHFPALVSLGHTALHQGELLTAADCYQRALRLNPRLTTVREMLQKLEPILGGNGKLPT
jgi:tetratricopeptide (TPR) repeat protein